MMKNHKCYIHQLTLLQQTHIQLSQMKMKKILPLSQQNQTKTKKMITSLLIMLLMLFKIKVLYTASLQVQ
jgi:hypothetical protein